MPQTPCDCQNKLDQLVSQLLTAEREFSAFGPNYKADYKVRIQELFKKADEYDKLTIHCKKVFKEVKDECSDMPEAMSLWDCGEYIVTTSQKTTNFCDELKSRFTGDWTTDSTKWVSSPDNPENPASFLNYLNREKYGSWPILYGPYWASDSLKMDSTFVDSIRSKQQFFPRIWGNAKTKKQ